MERFQQNNCLSARLYDHQGLFFKTQVKNRETGSKKRYDKRDRRDEERKLYLRTFAAKLHEKATPYVQVT